MVAVGLTVAQSDGHDMKVMSDGGDAMPMGVMEEDHSMHGGTTVADHSSHMANADSISHIGHDTGHKNHDDESICNDKFCLRMPMYFHTNTEVTFLIEGEGWTALSAGGYSLGWLATFFLAIVVEGLLFARSYLFNWLKIRAV